ncbi:UNVERIFIED_CONTAM: hypothetical protein Scaly_2838100 [Sesamum calycinum]|uniref:Retrotransposon gag domain-containing protein n=1 Tax=Sesamum calycinum TaxID=2727403 RepID=A0AAW2ISM5_9LAMI
MKPTPDDRSETFQVEDLEPGHPGPMETCTKYCRRVSSAGDVDRLCNFSGLIGKVSGISALQETIDNLKMMVKEELPQFVEKGLVLVLDKIRLTDVVDFKLEALRVVKLTAARVPDEEKVSITSMYLTGDAKLVAFSFCRMIPNANRKRIEMWEVLKKELKDQFLPCNTSWIARESLRNLKHTGTVREFVKEIELRRQGVNDLPSAIAATNHLGDFKVVNDPEQRNDDFGEGRAKFGKKFKNKGESQGNGDRNFRASCGRETGLATSSAAILNTERGIAQNVAS